MAYLGFLTSSLLMKSFASCEKLPKASPKLQSHVLVLLRISKSLVPLNGDSPDNLK